MSVRTAASTPTAPHPSPISIRPHRRSRSLPDPRPGPESEVLTRDRVRQIEAALARLRPEHRAIVLMRDLSGMSYEEIAQSLDLPLGTVRSRLARARAGLQAELLRRDPTILEATL